MYNQADVQFIFICPAGSGMNAQAASFMKSLPCPSFLVTSSSLQADSLRTGKIQTLQAPGIDRVMKTKNAFCFFMDKKGRKAFVFTLYKNGLLGWDNYSERINELIKNHNFL